VRAILRDDDEVEDVIQEAYINAYKHLADFAGRAQFSTWLTRIAIHEALARRKRGQRLQQLDEDSAEGGFDMFPANGVDPEQDTANGELASLLETAIMSLPEQFRTVVMLRDVEELSTSETAAALEISEENVKTRLHRGRALVRRNLYARVGSDAPRAFVFMGERCDRVVRNVLAKLSRSSISESTDFRIAPNLL
jgi:RNA polymerase sigma-70 factor (ECF subfamily)